MDNWTEVYAATHSNEKVTIHINDTVVIVRYGSRTERHAFEEEFGAIAFATTLGNDLLNSSKKRADA